MDLRWVVLLLNLTSIITGRQIDSKSDSKMKIIQAKYDVDDFDCVDISKQPAFSHPLLKNHKIQMKPSFLKMSGTNEVNPFNMSNIGLKGEGCPSRKVPIQKRKANTSFHQFSSTHPGQHFATLQYWWKNHGARARIDTYNPYVVGTQISASYIWIQQGDVSDLNNIQAGWAVHPRFYGDTVTRLTTYWTRDNYQRTGCYNVQCPGFMQISAHFYLGMSVGRTSTYGGDQYDIEIMIKQDPKSGNWWLSMNDEPFGYWPKEIFSHLQKGATYLQYGGWVFVSPDGSSPPMGSGHLANNNYKQSCYFKKIQFVDETGLWNDVLDNRMKTYVDTRCYNIIYWGNQGSTFEKVFTFGGPGGQCGI